MVTAGTGQGRLGEYRRRLCSVVDIVRIMMMMMSFHNWYIEHFWHFGYETKLFIARLLG